MMLVRSVTMSPRSSNSCTYFRTVFSLIGLGFLATIINSLLGLVSLAFLVLSIIGIVNAVNGKAKQLPVIGKFTLIK